MNKISRRWFIGGAGAFGAFGGCRFLECHDFRAGGRPNLRFGVVSDIHVTHFTDGRAESGGTDTFEETLRWFDEQKVDAVIIAGDMADNGAIAQLEAVAKAWYKIFPGDYAADGRRVERLFVYGNHDFGGPSYLWSEEFKGLSDDEKKRIIIATDPAAAWRKAFDEDFEPLYRRNVKGYDFVGAHWVDRLGCSAKDEVFNGRIGGFYEANARSFDPALPFFHFQHPHPKDTCYGPWAWGRDDGGSTKALSAFPNAVAFSGHSHYSLTDERSVWQGAFTSVGTSSLRYTALTYEEFPGTGYENGGTMGKDAKRVNAEKLMKAYEPGDCRQGMLWSVYDDCIVVKRREFISGLDVGNDWVLPLPAAESKPFAFVEHARKIGLPRFPEGAKLTLRKTVAKNRGGKVGDQTIAAVEREVLEVVIPPAVAVNDARVHEYVVRAECGDRVLEKRVVAEGFNHAPSHRRVKMSTCCRFSLSELGTGKARVTVVPENCFHAAGEPLVGEI